MKLTAIKFPLAVILLLIAVGGYVAFAAEDRATKITITKVDPDALNRTGKNPTFTITVPEGAPEDAKIALMVDTQVATTVNQVADQNSYEIPLKLGKGKYAIRAVLSGGDAAELKEFDSDPVPITVDGTGPKLKNATAVDNNTAVLITFEDSDLELGLVTENLTITQKTAAGSAKVEYNSSIESKNDGFSIKVAVAGEPLPLGTYFVSVEAGLLDMFGNPATAPLEAPFDVAVISPPVVGESLTGMMIKLVPDPDDQLLVRGSERFWLTSNRTVKIGVAGLDLNAQGTLVARVNNRSQDPVSRTGQLDDVKLVREGLNTVSVSFIDAQSKVTTSSNSINVVLDEAGPLLQHIELVDAPTTTGTEPTLLATFANDDFGDVTKEMFTIHRMGVQGVLASEEFKPGDAVVEGRTIRLSDFTPALPAGDYQLEVLTALKDKAGNPVGRRGETYPQGLPQKAEFSVMGQRKFGKHVEFTPFAPPKKQPIPEEGFNPGDKVVTRVARLFYFRDAHRVAQIINRNIRSYNEAAVTQAERRAENSRDDADNSTDERRQKERAAVRAAQKTREEEQKLASAQQQLAEAQRLERTKSNYDEQKEELNGEIETLGQPVEGEDPKIVDKRNQLNEQMVTLNAQIERTTKDLTQYGDTQELSSIVASLQQSVANLRENELNSRDEWNDAQAKEARARAKQFRDEVTAAETDPDTYVAGDIHSVDPVTQCSLSVIGEGLIQIRGPIKGINTIRTMINQIDSPVGQIKIGIFSVQVNGEEGDKMEKVVGDAEGSIDLSRFLVNQSLNLLRRSIQTEAAIIAEQCDLEGHYQVDRDRRYLYAFFGRDFIDELYEMNSEFMFTENKLLSLHAMDTISFNRAMFMLALAKNDVRQRIVDRFLESAKTELPDAEFDFRRSSELKPHTTQKRFPPWNLTRLPIANRYHKEEVIHEAVHRNALQRYHFRNFSSYFDYGFTTADTMNPMQREFIRLAQIFKARLVAEMEWKQRVMERALIEERSNDEDARFAVMQNVHKKAMQQLQVAFEAMLDAQTRLLASSQVLDGIQAALSDVPSAQEWQARETKLGRTINSLMDSVSETVEGGTEEARLYSEFYQNEDWLELEKFLAQFTGSNWLSSKDHDAITTRLDAFKGQRERLSPPDITGLTEVFGIIAERRDGWARVLRAFAHMRQIIEQSEPTSKELQQLDVSYKTLSELLPPVKDTNDGDYIDEKMPQLYQAKRSAITAQSSVRAVEEALKTTRGDLDHRKLLNLLIDEQEDKFIELVEGTRSHISVMDQYLKRLSIALEDDFKVQFYDPAFVRVRDAARGEPVNLSQVERTTILTNNRAFAKVDPQATMEFDLPKRQIAIKEAFDAAKALVEDTGALMNDPTFLSAFQMMGGATQPSTVKNLLPGQSTSLDQQNLGHVPPQPQSAPGSALQSLVPEPAIYKIETGTGFQIRPVMQPDGDSAVYDFDYMYTTNIREPVRADEKHVGRIKRHFVHTAVQTGNFELREISRYQVALKVSRTSRGVPLLEDIPVLGAVFRPAPSDESSLQQNIIFGQTNIYPTLFDLMGLRWAQQVVDLDHTSLLDTEHVIRGRQKSMKDYVFGVASRRVDEFLDLQRQTPSNYRPDFYHQQTLPSPHHPSGYVYPGGVRDPSGNGFERFDRRPPEMQEPPYDRYRHQPVHPEHIGPQILPQSVPPREDPVRGPYGESEVQLQRLPQADVQQFESLLLQGPNGTDGPNERARFNQGAAKAPTYQWRAMPVQGLDASQGRMLENDRPYGRLQVSNMAPKLRPTPLGAYRGPVTDNPVVGRTVVGRTAASRFSAVVPASFEQNKLPQRKRIQRLPPVR